MKILNRFHCHSWKQDPCFKCVKNGYSLIQMKHRYSRTV